MRIAVIDDSTVIRDLVKKYIHQNFEGAKVLEADNGKNGMTLLSREKVHLILCDWEMPEVDGEELLKWVRQHETLSETPFIMVTSRGDKEFVVKAIELKVSDYLVKPFNTKQFLERVFRAYKRHGLVIPTSNLASEESIKAKASSDVSCGEDSLTVLAAAPAQKTRKNPTSNTSKSGVRGLATIRSADGEVKCALSKLDLTNMVGIFKVGSFLPTILEHVSVDIEFRSEENAKNIRINGFIQSLKSYELKPDSQRIMVKVQFIDEDPQKQKMISEYVEQFG